jgi:hypothetical protein
MLTNYFFPYWTFTGLIFNRAKPRIRLKIKFRSLLVVITIHGVDDNAFMKLKQKPSLLSRLYSGLL